MTPSRTPMPKLEPITDSQRICIGYVLTDETLSRKGLAGAKPVGEAEVKGANPSPAPFQ